MEGRLAKLSPTTKRVPPPPKLDSDHSPRVSPKLGRKPVEATGKKGKCNHTLVSNTLPISVSLIIHTLPYNFTFPEQPHFTILTGNDIFTY